MIDVPPRLFANYLVETGIFKAPSGRQRGITNGIPLISSITPAAIYHGNTRATITISGKLPDGKPFLCEVLHHRQALPELLLDGLTGHR